MDEYHLLNIHEEVDVRLGLKPKGPQVPEEDSSTHNKRRCLTVRRPGAGKAAELEQLKHLRGESSLSSTPAIISVRSIKNGPTTYGKSVIKLLSLH